ncbi:MAG: hypothetical protein JNK49_10425 [Planctomycetes bacterium]|nr:hypothetical protein [Planctomycetota bacterium]
MKPQGEAPDLLQQDRDLQQLFAGRRPDAGRFAVGVAARIRARTAALVEGEVRAAHEPQTRVARAAASALPDGAAWLGAKSLLTWLSWPALLLAGSLLGGLGAARELRRDLRGAAVAMGQPSVRSRVGLFLATLPLPLLLVVGIWYRVPLADLLVGLVLMAMVAFVVQVRLLARHGGTRRDHVAGFAVSLLETLFQISMCWTFFGGLAGQEPWEGAGVVWTLLLGVVALLPFVAAPRRWLGLGYVALLIALLPPSTTLRRDSPAAVAADVAAARPAAGELIDWHALASAVEALRAQGTAVDVGAGLRDDLRGWLADGVDLHPQVLSAAVRIGCLDRSAWQDLVGLRKAAAKLSSWDRQGQLYSPDYGFWELPALLATRPGDAAQRAHWLQRVDTLWPNRLDPAAAGMPLVDAWLALRWRELLDAPEPTAELVAAAHRLLLKHQVAKGQRGAGGFTDFPNEQYGDNAAAAFRALDLLARCGAPPGLDLEALHTTLRRNVQQQGAIGRAARGDGLLHRANLVRFEQLFGATSLTPARWLLEARVMLAMLAVVLLCGYAVWLAPPERQGPGALP